MPGAAELESAFVLHKRRFRDTSLLVDLFTRVSGRVTCVARGALCQRRADTRFEPFQPLKIGLSGRGEVMTLRSAEPSGPVVALQGRLLFCGMYVNELLLRLTVRGDPMPELFDAYERMLGQLDGQTEPALRRFEMSLLRQLGVGLSFDKDTTGAAVDPARYYAYHADEGFRLVDASSTNSVQGGVLLALHVGEFGEGSLLIPARELMRRLISDQLGGKPLRSRELFR